AERSSAAPPIIQTSALTGEGIPALRQAILRHVAGDRTTHQESGFLTNVRHQKLVNDPLAALDDATNAVAARVPHAMLLLALYRALRPLDEITGVTTTDNILNLSFSTFFIFFFQAEDGIRDWSVTGVQTCALPICNDGRGSAGRNRKARRRPCD